MAIDNVLRGLLRFCLCFFVLLRGGEAQVAVHDGPMDSVNDDRRSSVKQSFDATSVMFHDALNRAASAAATCPTTISNYITYTSPQSCMSIDYVATPTSISSYDFRSSTESTQYATNAVDSITSSGSPSISIPSEREILGASISAQPRPVESPNPAIASSQPLTHISLLEEEDLESPLDNANFLSFEEWKVQNLVKAGQSPEHVGRGQAININRPRPDLTNALDALGDEGEINLDFTGFGSGASPTVPIAAQREAMAAFEISDSEHASPPALTVRSKDAGKTCKERTNYASFDCAATALKSNKECKSASAILVENKDSYLLNKCSAENKFIIIELCDDILVDTVVLANYEFFSSSFRHFRVSVSDRYPVKIEKWKDLGTYEARNTREIQAFLVQNPLIWARYLRIEFLTHYGNEYYCPVSLLRVHGTTMLEEFRHQEDAARGDEEEATQEAAIVLTAIEDASSVHISNGAVEGSTEAPLQNEKQDSSDTGVGRDVPADTSAAATITATVINETISEPSQPANDGFVTSSSTRIPIDNLNTTCEAIEVVRASSLGVVASATETTITTVAATILQQANSKEGVTGQNKSKTISSVPTSAATRATESSTATSQKSPAASSSTTSSAQASSKSQGSAQISNSTTASSGSKSTNHTIPTTNTNRTASATVVSSQPPQPSTQESFFKSVHKRLQQLESNSTLSLKYIEEQSRILRDAFTKVEKRQVSTTSNFLANLNQTVISELQGLRTAYDQLWQSTVIELEGQRQLSQHEMLAMSARLTMVADELVWQKRMGILQSTLLLLCLALVLFGRTSNNGYLEMPIMQQMMNRSTAALRTSWESPPGSPSPESRSPVSLFRQKLWRASPEPMSENLTDSDKEGLELRLEPPTPSSQLSAQSEDEDNDSDQNGPADGLETQHDAMTHIDALADMGPKYDDIRATEALEMIPRLSENT